MKVVYLLDAYPVLSETFVLREIRALRADPRFEVEVFSITSAPRGKTHPDAVEEKRLTTYFSSRKRWATRRALAIEHLLALTKHPLRYIRCVCLAGSGSRRQKQLFLWMLRLHKVLNLENASHVRVHFVLDASFLALLLNRYFGVEYSVTVHAHDIFLAKHEQGRQAKLRNATAIVSISQFNVQYLANKYPALANAPFRIVHCGVDPKEFPYREFRPAIKEPIKILSVGRLVEQKGYRHLIDACSMLRDQTPFEFSLEILGDGPLRQELEEQTVRLGLQRHVAFLGSADQDGVQAALNECDIFVLACVVESTGTMDGIPVALMEALAQGIPTISTKISGIPELIDATRGRLVPSEDSNALAAAMAEIIAMDAAQREAMCKNARTFVLRHFNSDTELEKLISIIDGTFVEAR